ncbi:hypothetical protein [Negadavirga shengliensis]|uniref:Uncharacterized protein n=1 Tax=Negadavirga shengliensis TaxID=1389218 RepID=A0ABV9T4V6_9BACT
MNIEFFLLLVPAILNWDEAREDSLKRKPASLPFYLGYDYGKEKSTLEFVNVPVGELENDTTWVRVGGAFRLNAIYAYFEGQTFPLGTALRNEWTWDTWRVNVDAYSQGLQFSFEYRFYPTFNANFIKYGWIGYRFNEQTNLQLGITQVPFGLLTYASHSWWFQLPYYLGLEDDHQMGFNLTHELDHWRFNLAYFLLSEPRGTSESGFGAFSTARYSYDVVPVPGNNNLERHQINLRIARKWEDSELGASYQQHEVYNLITRHRGHQRAMAVHYQTNWRKWNLKAETIYYRYKDVRNDDNVRLNVVQMGAYGFGTYDVAMEGVLYVLGLAYNIPVNWGPVSHIQLYNDYTLMQKLDRLDLPDDRRHYRKSQQNVFGALVTAGHIYSYFDVAMGYNHPWITDAFGGNALGTGRGVDYREPVSTQNPLDPHPGWNARLNINLGYYF